jgi:RNA polymerase sigma-70 factor (ECF subfamily)
MSWMEIAILVDKAKQGDRQAYGEIIRRFTDCVQATAFKHLRNSHEAEELTQDVFIHAMDKLDQLRDPRCFPSWIRRMTVRMAINRVSRKSATFGTEPEFFDAVPGATRTPDAELQAREARAEVQAGLKRLKPDDQATLEAFYVRGQTLIQMAEEFDAPIGTIKRRLHVARHRLKTILENPHTPRAKKKPRAVATA